MHSTSALRIFSKAVCFLTVLLVFAGSMVTSTGSGLAVPDWPLSYGTLFPPMVGGVFYEHGHRMVASLVGFLTLILAIWLNLKEKRKWVRILGFCALGAVILQGVLGGITVLFFLPTPISVLHGILAQSFLLMTIMIAYSQSVERKEKTSAVMPGHKTAFVQMMAILVITVYVQLIIGAVMRHTNSGLAIPDFPTMGGRWVPLFDQPMLENINSWRFENDFDPVSIPQVFVHFAHRVTALIILVQVCFLISYGLKYYRKQKNIFNNIFLLSSAVIVQIFLGVVTVLTKKLPLVTSLHVVNGAVVLSYSFLLLLRNSPNGYAEFKELLCKRK